MSPLLATLRQVVSGQLPPAIAADPDQAERHVRFALILLGCGAVGLAALPPWLAIGAPGGIGVAAMLASAMAPLAIAALVLRTGRLRLGRRLSVLAATIFAGTAAALAGHPIAAIPIAALVIAGVALGPPVAERIAARRHARTARDAETTAPRDPFAQAEAVERFAADIGGSIESLVSLSTRLADQRLVLGEDEAGRMVRLIRAAGASAQRGLDAMAGRTATPGDEPASAPADLGSALRAAVAANAETAADRGVSLRVASPEDLERLALDGGVYAPIFTGFIAAGLRACREGASLLAAIDDAEGRVRVVLRAGYAVPAPSDPTQPFLQPRSPYTGAGRESGHGLAEVGRRIAALGGALKLGRRGPGGVIVALHLPIAAVVTRGGDRHQEERRIEVRKRA